MEIYVLVLESHLPFGLLAAGSLSSTGKREREQKRGRRHKGEGRRRKSLGFRRCHRRCRPWCPFFLPQNRLGSISCFGYPIDLLLSLRALPCWRRSEQQDVRSGEGRCELEMTGRSREGEEGVVAGSFGVVLAVVSLGENANINPLLIKFCGLKNLFGWGLVE